MKKFFNVERKNIFVFLICVSTSTMSVNAISSSMLDKFNDTVNEVVNIGNGVTSKIKDYMEVKSKDITNNENNSKVNFEGINNNVIENKINTSSNSFLKSFSSYLCKVNNSKSLPQVKLDLINSIQELQKNYSSDSLDKYLSDELVYNIINSDAKNVKSLITELNEKLNGNSNLISRILKKDGDATINAITAGKVSGSEYNVSLHSNIYYSNVDASGNPTSKKWVIALHGFLMDGQSIANSYGKMYLDNGYNVLAPDLRGFGSSKGSVAWGYVEAHDTWDWLTYLNKTYGATDIIVHGVSLGGATVVQLSGLSIDAKTIKDQNVIGLVEDCGFTSMTKMVTDSIDEDGNNIVGEKILNMTGKASLSDIVGKDMVKNVLINNVKVGLNKSNYDIKENGLNSLKKSQTPLLIIHGTNDKTIPYDNSNRIYSTAKNNPNIPYVKRFSAEGEPHAFIVMGFEYENYNKEVTDFINKVEMFKNPFNNNVIINSNYSDNEVNKTQNLAFYELLLNFIKDILLK